MPWYTAILCYSFHSSPSPKSHKHKPKKRQKDKRKEKTVYDTVPNIAHDTVNNTVDDTMHDKMHDTTSHCQLVEVTVSRGRSEMTLTDSDIEESWRYCKTPSECEFDSPDEMG